MYPREYDGATVKAWAGDSQFRAWRADLARFRKWGYTGWGSEGFWALSVYRMQRGLYPHKERWWAKPPRAGLAVAKKILSVVTHIHLDEASDIGPGLLIPHSGPVRVHADAKIGADCALHHVVTIGAGTRPGAAQIGDHVMVGCHAAILGPVRIGDCAMVAASSLVLSDVPAMATALGVPARLITPPQAAEPRQSTRRASTPTSSTEPAVVVGEPFVPARKHAFDRLSEHARTRPHDSALTTVRASGSVEQRTFASLHADAARCAGYLRSKLEPHEPALIFAQRSAQSVALLLGAIGDGRAFSCLNPRWRWAQLRRVLALTGARHLFVDSETRALIERSAGADERAGLVLVEISEASAFVSASEPTRTACATSAERLGCLLFTSGSTGEPKGVCVSEAELAARAEGEVALFSLSERDVLLNLLPFSFDVGLNQVLSTIHAGGHTVISESWLPDDVLALVARYGVSGIPCVPSIWQDFIHLELAFDTRKAHRSLRFITLSGGDLPPKHLELLARMAPDVQVFKTYGQTEAFRASALTPAEFLTQRGSVGRPLPGVTVAIARKDGSLAVRGELGEIVHAGQGTMLGYLEDRDQSAQKLRASPLENGEIACFSGDHGYIDDAGLIHVVGREDQMLKLNGHRVYPQEVRNLLCDLPELHDAIVLGERGRSGESVLFAFVTCREECSGAELKRKARELLPGYMLPRQIVIHEALPRTASGKPDGEALRPAARALLEASPSVGEAADAPLPYIVDIVEQQIALFLQGHVDPRFDIHAGSLQGVLDSLLLIELTQALEQNLGLSVAIARLSTRALESTRALAAAILADARPRLADVRRSA